LLQSTDVRGPGDHGSHTATDQAACAALTGQQEYFSASWGFSRRDYV